MRARCQGCPNRNAKVIPGQGDPNGIAVVGQAPGYYEGRKERIFVGKSGRLLRHTISACNLGPTFYTNAVACVWDDEEPTPDAILACRQSLIKELEDARSTKVLASGNAAIQALVPGSRAVSLLRPNRLRSVELDVPVVPTYNLAYVLRDADAFRDVLADIDVLIDIDNWVAPAAPPYTVVDSRDSFKRMLKDIDTSSHIALDLETTAFNPREDELLTIGIGDGKHVWIITNELVEGDKFVHYHLKKLLENRGIKKSGQNWNQFDWKWMWVKHGIDVRTDFDSMLAHYTLDERQMGHGLKSMAKQYLGFPDYAKDIKGFVENYGDIPFDELCTYQAWDVRATWDLTPVLRQQMTDDDPCLHSVHDDLLLPAALALGQIELNGVTLDLPYLEHVQRDIEGYLTRMQAQLQEISDEVGCTDLAGARAYEKECGEAFKVATAQYARQQVCIDCKRKRDCDVHRAEYITGREKIQIRAEWTRAKKAVEGNTFNPLSSPQVKRLMWEHLHLTPDTTRAGLEAVEHLHPAPHIVAVYRQFAKLRGTYLVGLRDRIWASDGRLHGSFLLIGTRTGRISSRDPNLQNMPLIVGPVIRNMFVSRDGWVLGEADNSQVEIRIAGVLSQDKEIIALYQRGEDVHRKVASQMYSVGYDDVTSQQRQDAKPVDFSILYGATAESLVGTGDPPWDLAQAQRAVDGFIGAFPDLGRHFEIWKQEVLRDGYLKTISGRIRRFPLITDDNRSDIERIAINSRIQGSASDLLLQALTRVQLSLFDREWVTIDATGERFQLNPDMVSMMLTVHDSILFEAHPDIFPLFAAYLKQEMERTDFETYGMPFEAEVKAGKRWGSLKKWHPGDIVDLAAAESDQGHYTITYYYQTSDRTPRPLDEVATAATIRRIPATARADAETIKRRNEALKQGRNGTQQPAFEPELEEVPF